MPSRIHKLILILLLGAAACARAGGAAPATATSVPEGPSAPSTALSQATATLATALTPPALTQVLQPAHRFFTETFSGSAPDWTYQQAGNGQPMEAPQIRDGFLVFELVAPNQWAYALYGGPATADVRIEAQVQDRSGGDSAAGVVCRYDKIAGWYELDVFTDGTYQLLYGRWLASGVASYAPLYRGESGAMGRDENTIGLQCQGNRLTPSINGQALRQWQELKFGLKQGQAGLSVSSFGDVPLVIAFDSVKVSEP